MICHDLDKGTMVNHDLARFTMIMARVLWHRTLGWHTTLFQKAPFKHWDTFVLSCSSKTNKNIETFRKIRLQSVIRKIVQT